MHSDAFENVRVGNFKSWPRSVAIPIGNTDIMMLCNHVLKVVIIYCSHDVKSPFPVYHASSPRRFTSPCVCAYTLEQVDEHGNTARPDQPLNNRTIMCVF